jgi:meiotically up-regulated gene 157 (Mug157) protein
VVISLAFTSVLFQFNHYSQLHGNVGQIEILQEEISMKEGEMAEMKSAARSKTHEFRERLDALQAELVTVQERLLETDGEREEAEELLRAEQQKNHARRIAEGANIGAKAGFIESDGDKKAVPLSKKGRQGETHTLRRVEELLRAQQQETHARHIAEGDNIEAKAGFIESDGDKKALLASSEILLSASFLWNERTSVRAYGDNTRDAPGTENVDIPKKSSSAQGTSCVKPYQALSQREPQFAYSSPTDLRPVPAGVDAVERWRYDSDGVYWTEKDEFFSHFMAHREELKEFPSAMSQEIQRLCGEAQDDQVCRMLQKNYPDTWTKSMTFLNDSTAYIVTGDINMMWMRDSVAQIYHYLPLASGNEVVQIMFEATLRRLQTWISLDPYGSAFRLYFDFDHAKKPKLTKWDFRSGRTAYVAQHNYEIDSLCYFVRLSYQYWKTTGVSRHLTRKWKRVAKSMIDLWVTEQDHDTKSCYRYPEVESRNTGSKICRTGMTWGAFRPSDDLMRFNFNVPANMFVHVSLKQIAEIAKTVFQDAELYDAASNLAVEIAAGIEKFGIVQDAEVGPMYAYEVDGCGEVLKGDDANIPSLLSAPYLGFDENPEVYENTRKFLLSNRNKQFFCSSTKDICGIGSSHTPGYGPWHMAIVMQGLTAKTNAEKKEVLKMLKLSTKDDALHEAFKADSPASYTRKWFGWPNSLFAEFVRDVVDV